MPIRTYHMNIVAADLGALGGRRCANDASALNARTAGSGTDTANLPLRGRMFMCSIYTGGSRYGDMMGNIARLIFAFARLCAGQRRCAS